LQKQFENATMKVTENPAEYIADMQNLAVKITEADPDFAIKEKVFITRILNSLPKAYEGLVETIENSFDKTMSNADLKDIREKLVLKYQRLNGMTHEGKSNTSDKVLYGGGFKGRCNKCGKYGHKGSACRSSGTQEPNQGNLNKNSKSNKSGGNSNQSNQNLSNVQCHYCKEMGHYKSDCPKIKAKKDGGNNRGFGGSGGSDQNNSGGGNNSTIGSRTTTTGHGSSEVVLTVTERYTKLAACTQCGEVGFFNQECKTCYVGSCTKKLSEEEKGDFGSCETCHDIGPIGNYCQYCDDESNLYTRCDTDSIHLDLMEYWRQESNTEEESEEKDDPFGNVNSPEIYVDSVGQHRFVDASFRHEITHDAHARTSMIMVNPAKLHDSLLKRCIVMGRRHCEKSYPTNLCIGMCTIW
jgi:gag-polypeptide of LTR copia-type/Zinc knuckle